MSTSVLLDFKVADQVWVAVALLHRENPQRNDFSNQEIRARAEKEYPEGAKRQGIPLHISTHCVASKPPNPARHRMLTRTGTGRRRLFRTGDAYHPGRAEGSLTPKREDLPEKYHDLLDWYEQEYNKPSASNKMRSKQQGATAETLMKLMGRISREDGNELIRIIDECCGTIDPNEW